MPPLGSPAAVGSGLLFLFVGLHAQEPIALPLPTVGQKAAFVQHTLGRQQSTGRALEQDIYQEYTVAVVAAADGTTRFEVTYDRVHGAVDLGPQGRHEFDSAHAAAQPDAGQVQKPEVRPPLQAAAETIRGMKFSARVDDQGAVEVAGYEAIAAQAREAAAPYGDVFDSLVAPRSLAQMVRNALGPRPTQPVAIGASWLRDEEVGSRLVLLRKLTCSLAKCDERQAEFAVRGVVSAVPGADGPLADAVVEDGKEEGRIVIARADGFVANSTRTMSMTVVAMGGRLEIDLEVVATVERAAVPQQSAAEPAGR